MIISMEETRGKIAKTERHIMVLTLAWKFEQNVNTFIHRVNIRHAFFGGYQALFAPLIDQPEGISAQRQAAPKSTIVKTCAINHRH